MECKYTKNLSIYSDMHTLFVSFFLDKQNGLLKNEDINKIRTQNMSKFNLLEGHCLFIFFNCSSISFLH